MGSALESEYQLGGTERSGQKQVVVIADTTASNWNSKDSSWCQQIEVFLCEKDDLDAYLIRFERACTAFEVQQAHSWQDCYRVKPWMYINGSQMTRLIITMC